MKMYELSLVILLALLVGTLVGGGSYYLWGPDNVVEEVAEKIIDVETGLNVDLSPKTTEAKSEEKPTVTGE